MEVYLRSQSLYHKCGPNLPTSLTHRISIRPKVANLGDLMRLWVQTLYQSIRTCETLKRDTYNVPHRLPCGELSLPEHLPIPINNDSSSTYRTNDEAFMNLVSPSKQALDDRRLWKPGGTSYAYNVGVPQTRMPPLCSGTNAMLGLQRYVLSM